MNSEDGVRQEIRKMGHKGVSDASEVRAITHFLSEDVCRIDFARNMLNLESLVLHSFTIGVHTKFDVTSSLRGHVVQPLHTRVIVVVQESGRVEVRNNITSVGDTLS